MSSILSLSWAKFILHAVYHVQAVRLLQVVSWAPQTVWSVIPGMALSLAADLSLQIQVPLVYNHNVSLFFLVKAWTSPHLHQGLGVVDKEHVFHTWHSPEHENTKFWKIYCISALAWYSNLLLFHTGFCRFAFPSAKYGILVSKHATTCWLLWFWSQNIHWLTFMCCLITRRGFFTILVANVMSALQTVPCCGWITHTLEKFQDFTCSASAVMCDLV